MNGLAFVRGRDLDEASDVEITFIRRAGAYTDRFNRSLEMLRATIGFRIDSDVFHTDATARSGDPAGNLAAIGDEYA